MHSNQTDNNTNTLIEIKNLIKYFPVEGGILQRILSTKREFVHAIDDINLSIDRGEIFCLVGESGCGKTTTANVLVGLEIPTSGQFYWKGENISYNDLKPKKGDIKSQIVFQNPFSALSPRMRLGESVLHSLITHNKVTNEDTKKKLRNSNLSEIILVLSTLISAFLLILSLMTEGSLGGIIAIISSLIFILATINYIYFSLIQKSKIKDPTILKIFEEVGLSPSLQYYLKYPHEVSGGERQRVNIARAIILNPQLLIADEPTSMLDVSLRAGILDSLQLLQKTHNISILFITHDLATARHFGDRIGIMYVGKLVESGDIESIFKKPLHPYTKALIDAIPTPVPGEKDYVLPKGEVADSIKPPVGCRYHPRCPKADLSICAVEEPELKSIFPNHLVACHFPLNSS